MERKPLTVTALNKYLKYCFDHDENLQNILIKGEISNYKLHSSGHIYLTLKDETSQINVVMFHKQAQKITIDLEDGMNVIVEGYVSLYVTGGTYQIYATNIVLDGIGELFLRFEKLKEKLFKEGLFSQEHKLPLPKYPQKIAVITSRTGAAIRDIITTIERRYPICEVIVFPTLVQGEYAKDDIIKSLNKANSYKDIDLIILGRGGGSIEDLWPFNEEEVARAIFASKIPIISAVGHETDLTISDYVSDLRAATPTAAAELAVPNKNDLLLMLKQYKERIYQAINNLLKVNKDNLTKIKNSYIFINPNRIYEQNYLILDKLFAIIEKYNPLSLISKELQKLQNFKTKIDYLYERKYQINYNLFVNIINKLELVNPLSLLNKGYAIIKKDNLTISSIEDVNLHDIIEVLLKDGIIYGIVKDKEVKSYE